MAVAVDLEARLRILVAANRDENRQAQAAELKKLNKPIIGLIDSYTPEEVIYAAGMIPWRISGTWQADTGLAEVYRPRNTDSYCLHVLQAALQGDLDFLDGIVVAAVDDDLRRLYDQFEQAARIPFLYLLRSPAKNDGIMQRWFGDSLLRLVIQLEDHFSVKVHEEDLREAIAVYNKWRGLLTRLYDLRKREHPAVTGSEALGIVTASYVMPKDEFNRELEEILPALEQRKAPLKSVRPRLLISSDKVDNPDYVRLIEDLGACVAMDDLDTASRYFWGPAVDGSARDPLLSIAQHYVSAPRGPQSVDWPKYEAQLKEWLADFKVDGFLSLLPPHSYLTHMVSAYIIEKLRAAGVQCMEFDMEYRLANEGQLRTRIQAFIELLES